MFLMKFFLRIFVAVKATFKHILGSNFKKGDTIHDTFPRHVVFPWDFKGETKAMSVRSPVLESL